MLFLRKSNRREELPYKILNNNLPDRRTKLIHSRLLHHPLRDEVFRRFLIKISSNSNKPPICVILRANKSERGVNAAECILQEEKNLYVDLEMLISVSTFRDKEEKGRRERKLKKKGEEWNKREAIGERGSWRKEEPHSTMGRESY